MKLFYYVFLQTSTTVIFTLIAGVAKRKIEGWSSTNTSSTLPPHSLSFYITLVKKCCYVTGIWKTFFEDLPFCLRKSSNHGFLIHISIYSLVNSGCMKDVRSSSRIFNVLQWMLGLSELNSSVCKTQNTTFKDTLAVSNK